MKLWLKNSEGKRDAVLTMTIATLVVVLLKVVISGVKFGDVEFSPMDAGLVVALLTPTLGAYVARRYTDKKLDPVVILDTEEEKKE